MLSAAAEEEKLHQVTFNTNHVLCSSAAAAGCWILKEESMQNSDISPSTYCPSLCKVYFLTVCYKDLISCCQLQQKKRSSIRSPSTPTMFSVALLLLLAAGSCESH
ncbi:hypothetical protein F7725_003616 [Dissostichus mawsoni]|uniref:Uncharacterized protein n=1 Tax=Dissostichus mawsoni TaxID=36200 RepID=A0A7J5YE24_DISMA|nr:hypothetical protein F7725_003616 [Dissostichus mawsoni]